MKHFKLFCLLLVASIVLPALAKAPKDKHKYGVYITGVSASFPTHWCISPIYNM